MEFVPYEFCDSVVLLTNPSELGEIEKLEGYWSEAARKPTNHHTGADLIISLNEAGSWECFSKTRFWNTMLNWKKLIEENHCLVINSVKVLPLGFFRNMTLSTAELKDLISYCYKKPFQLIVDDDDDPVYEFTTHQMSKITKLFQDLNICRMELFVPEVSEEFLVKALGSEHLVSIHIRNQVPTSLHPHIQEWSRRVEFRELRIKESPKLKFDFSVVENLMQRIQEGNARFPPFRRYRLNAKFSEADCVKIKNFVRRVGFTTSGGNIYDQGRWKKGNVKMLICNFRTNLSGNVQCVA